MEQYKFRITLGKSDKSGYIGLKHKFVEGLSKIATGLDQDLRENALIIQLSSERPPADIEAKMKEVIGHYQTQWKHKAFRIEHIEKVQAKPVSKSALDSMSDTIVQLLERIKKYEQNEEVLVVKQVELEKRIAVSEETMRNLGEAGTKLEERISNYKKDERRYRDHEATVKELTYLRTGMMRLMKSIDGLLHEKSSAKRHQKDYIIDAIKEGNHTVAKIMEYLAAHEVRTTAKALGVTLVHGKKPGYWKTTKRGWYELP